MPRIFDAPSRPVFQLREISRGDLVPVLGALVGASLLVASPVQADEPSVTSVSANYRIQLAGVKFGNYDFTSSRKGDSYTIASNAKLKAFFGAFKWRGSATSAGRVGRDGPLPSRYVYSFRKNKRAAKSVTLAMADRNVTSVKHIPQRNRNKGRVPLTIDHQRDVLDPMSALIALSTPGRGVDPCAQTVRVYDGLRRFDVTLTPKGRKTLDLTSNRGFERKARVCGISYRLIAGHKPGKKYDYIADPKGMQVWLAPARNGSMYVPYRIEIPTIVGSAVLQATSISLAMSDNTRIALSQ